MRWHLPWSAVDQSAEIAELRAEAERLRRDRHAARFERDQAIAERDLLRSDRDSLAERLAISTREELAQRREVDRLRAVLREIGAAAEAAAGNEPAHSGQFVAYSGPFGWIPVGERLPTDNDLDDYGDVLVAVRSDSGQPWTDRAYLDDDGRWRFSHDDCEPNPGVRITHWAPVPLPPGCEGAPPVLAAQPGPWIRVADALPDYHDEEVVALAGGQPWLARCSPVGGWRDCYGHCLDGVTHWARWPEGSGVAGEEGAADA